ncbi:MAG: undecaprenyl/decaprenyl-phosphate alpha-N-acetylglucosaminyl 1-phosphate transferase [candidate division KSB1 bacterium]|nr:undecaprenyl/decaprenyl-phosphate alpha-N-acetylglucosaminyl 1-phosphate transferase [candidate division KSB1 bacterium]
MIPFFALLVSFITAVVATPVFRRFAVKHEIVARQNHRTIHKGQIPKLGGGAVIFSFLTGALFFYVLKPSFWAAKQAEIASLVLGATGLFILGAFDDKKDLNCNLKLFVETALALLAVHFGWRMEKLILLADRSIELGFWSYPLSILWIVGITNAFNMIDGLDGLAGGVAVVVLICSSAIALLMGNTVLVPLMLSLIGATVGFLRYNMHPASIFMGDSGSLSIGFLLACLTLGASSTTGSVSPLLLFLLLGLPIVDTALAIFRRLRRGIHPFHADREHIHHRLVALGLTQPGASATMIGLSLILGIMAFLAAYTLYLGLHLMN